MGKWGENCGSVAQQLSKPNSFQLHSRRRTHLIVVVAVLWLFRVFVVRLLEHSSLHSRYLKRRMRIVRFHLEPWQRGSGCGSVTPSPAQSPSLALLSPHVLRRQRPASLEDLEEICGQSQTPQQQQQQRLRRQRRLKCRYPQVVKRLSTLCSDVMAHHVSNNRR